MLILPSSRGFVGGGFAPILMQITSSQTVAVPSGATMVDIFCAGGGQGGADGVPGGGGARSGYGAMLSYKTAQSLAGITSLVCTVGASGQHGLQTGSSGSNWGGHTYVADQASNTLVLAQGGLFWSSGPQPPNPIGTAHAGGQWANGGNDGSGNGTGGGGGGCGGSDSVGSDGAGFSPSFNQGGAAGTMTTMQSVLGVNWSSGNGGNGGAVGNIPGGGGGGGNVSSGTGFPGGNGARGEIYLRFYQG